MFKVSEQAGDLGQCGRLHLERKKAKNTKSSKKYKITIDGTDEKVEKTKTTINNIVMYYHDEVTHPDEVHEECVVQSSYW